MTPAEIIAEVRSLIQDTEIPLRYTDASLLAFVNQTVQKMSVVRPDLFTEMTEVDCAPDTVVQTAPSDSIRLIEVYSVVGGNTLVEVNKNALDEMYPQWMSDEAAPAVNWVRHVRAPNKFFIYPKAPEGQKLLIEYSKAPPYYELNDSIDVIADAYFPLLVNGTVYLAESIDAEHVNSQRAQLFQKEFSDMLGAGSQARIMTDTESGGEEPPPSEKYGSKPTNTTYG